jgi:streptogramin lyase
MLAEELGLQPGRALQELERAILRQDAVLDQPVLPPSRPPPAIQAQPNSGRRKRLGLAAVAVVLVGATALALALTRPEKAPPVVVANSLVRIDSKTLKPTKVVPIGNAPDMVIAAGGFLWVTHHVLRDVDSGALRNAGDRTLTRVDPTTGHTEPVGGGLAPCGLTADPSGDVWVANCYASAARAGADVVRIDAATLDFKETLPVPAGTGFYRGLAYGGGLLWVAPMANHHTLTVIDPRTRTKRSIRLARWAGALAWSDEYGDLWLNNFDLGSITRLHVATGDVHTIDAVATNPSFPVVDGDVLWAGDWAGPRIERLRAVGPPKLRRITLPTRDPNAGVWKVATGAGAVWATTPRDGALWRIDPKTNHLTRIPLAHLPTWVTVGADGALWLTVRGR